MNLQKCTVTVSSHVWKWIQLGMAVWIVMDIVFDVLQIRTYYRMWNAHHKFNIQKSSTTQIIELCEEFNNSMDLNNITFEDDTFKYGFRDDDFNFMKYWAKDCNILLLAK